MNRSLTRILLLFAGLMLFVIGAATLLVPHAFFAESGVTLGHNPSLLSEIRAPGGLLVGCAVVVLLGALWRSIRRQALMLAAMVYDAFGASRVLAMTLDGMPSESLLWATAIELVLATLCLLSLHRHQADSQTVPSASAMDVHARRTAATGV